MLFLRLFFVLGFVSMVAFSEPHGSEAPGRPRAEAPLLKSTREVVAELEKELKTTPEGERRKVLVRLLQSMRSEIVRLQTEGSTCDYKTCKGVWCKDVYDCRGFTHDFCNEWRRKESSFCEGFGFVCQAKEKKNSKGHVIALVEKSSSHSCAVEPQGGKVIACWKKRTYGGKILDDMDDEARDALYQEYPWLKNCVGEKVVGMIDSVILKTPKAFEPCCECYDPSTKGRSILFPAENLLYCTGTCADANKAFVRRVACPARISLNGE